MDSPVTQEIMDTYGYSVDISDPLSADQGLYTFIIFLRLLTIHFQERIFIGT